MRLSRRQLGALVGAAVLAPQLPGRPAVAAPAWKLMWSPSAGVDGLRAFETIEDDRAGSHPAGAPHISTEGDNFRFTMHTVDRDTSTDRQRHEVTGNRTPGGHLRWLNGETWRLTYSMYIPSSLKATTSFTHIMQTIEHKIFEQDILVGRTDLVPLQNRWIDIEYEMKIGDGGAGSVRWVVRSAGTTVVDATKTGVDTFLGDRVRPKWGIYRSLGDTSGSLQNCHLLLTDLRAYKLVEATGTRLEAENATISQGVVESDHAGYSGTGFVNTDNVAGAYVQWTHHAPAAGSATLTFRYANGSTTGRQVAIVVNGASTNVDFPATGAWSTWQNRSITVPLVAGANTIRATATTAGGCPNFDYLEILA